MADHNASIGNAVWVGGNKVSRRVFVAAKRVIVQRYLLGPCCIGDHQLDRIAVPGVTGDVFMVIVRHNESEVHVIGVIDDLDGRGLIVRPGPGAPRVLFEQDVIGIGVCA